jgi:general secretion pathway protein G
VVRRYSIFRGFSLIELLVVLAIIATLVAIVSPRYFHTVDKAKEAALKTNLTVMRDALDKFHADTGQYPQSLSQLVQNRFLREIPVDPILESAQAWVLVAHPAGQAGIYDIKSSAAGIGSNGIPFTQF